MAFLAPVRDLVEARAARILGEHRPGERPEPERYAFVPVDTRTGLAQTDNGWPDWTDGAERIGMASCTRTRPTSACRPGCWRRPMPSASATTCSSGTPRRWPR